MLTYRRPKSQLWGHRVARLSSAEALARSSEFLRERTVILNEPPIHFHVCWDPVGGPMISDEVGAIGRRIGQVPEVAEFRGGLAAQVDRRVGR